MYTNSQEALTGEWRITEMELWDQDAIDLVVPGFIKIDADHGEMRFIAVTAWLDIRYTFQNKKPFAEFSWEGVDDNDDRCGRGWVKLEEPDKLIGCIYFHMGDESGFEATRQ